ncbi:hypothetical protein BC829DRAFT_447359 [Chytridium lagenaria]|nr:hypothetical protein BC829DRAFT_447359 [Chytridium lagenaria]
MGTDGSPSKATEKNLRRITTQPARARRGLGAVISDPVKMVYKRKRVEFGYRKKSPTRPRGSRTVNEAMLLEEIEVDGDQKASRLGAAGEGVAGDDAGVPEQEPYQDRAQRLEEEIQLLEMELDMGEALRENDGNLRAYTQEMLTDGVGWEDVAISGQIRGGSHSIPMRTVPSSQHNSVKRQLYAEARRKLVAFEMMRIDMVREFLPHYMDKDIHLRHPDGVKNTADCGCDPSPSIIRMELRVKLKRHLAKLTRLLKEYNSGSPERHRRTLEELTLGGAEAEFPDDDSNDGHDEEDMVKGLDDEVMVELDVGHNQLTVKQVLEELELPEHHSDILEYWRNLEDLVLHQTDLDNAADHFQERRIFWTDVDRLVNLAAEDASANWPAYAQKAAVLWIQERSAQEEAIREAWASLQTYFDITQYHTFEPAHYEEVKSDLLTLLGIETDAIFATFPILNTSK